jgi:hypothetical protein
LNLIASSFFSSASSSRVLRVALAIWPDDDDVARTLRARLVPSLELGDKGAGSGFAFFGRPRFGPCVAPLIGDVPLDFLDIQFSSTSIGTPSSLDTLLARGGFMSPVSIALIMAFVHWQPLATSSCDMPANSRANFTRWPNVNARGFLSRM